MSANQLLKQATKINHRYPFNLDNNDLSDFKDAKSYSTNDVYMKWLGRVWLSSDSVVYKNGMVVTDTLAYRFQKNYYQVRHLMKNLIINKRVYLNGKKKYLLVTDNWSIGHFHWFCDVLPKLLCIENIAKDYILLLPDDEYIYKIALESMKYFNLPFDDLIIMKKTEFYDIKNLYYVSNIAKSGQMSPDLMKVMQNRFQIGDKSGTKRVYISRKNAAYRKVLNEDELIHVLKEYGFEVIQSEKLTLVDQIEIMSTTSTLMGLHGAGLTNSIFMQPGGNVIELRKKENGPFNVAYWHLSDSLDHQYYYFNGKPDSNKQLIGRGCNLNINMEEFKGKVLQKLD